MNASLVEIGSENKIKCQEIDKMAFSTVFCGKRLKPWGRGMKSTIRKNKSKIN